MDLQCREVVAAGQSKVEVVGSQLSEDSVVVREDFWVSF